MKKIIIIFVVVLLSLTGIFGIYKLNHSKTIDNKITKNIIKKSDENKIEKDKASEIKDDDQEVKDSPKNEEKNKINKEETNKAESKIESNKIVTNNNQTNQSNAKREEQPKQDVTKAKTPTVEQPKVERNPWEELGISEYDYYNKPMWNWMTIEFDVNSYGTQYAAERACRESGNKKAEAIIRGIQRNEKLIDFLLGEIEVYHDNSKAAFKVCFTKVRDKNLESEIEKAGGKVVNSVTADTTYLVVPDLDVVSSKTKSANKNNVKIIPIDEFYKVLDQYK